MIDRTTHSTSAWGKTVFSEGTKKIMSVCNKGGERTIAEKFWKEIKNTPLTKCWKGVKTFGIPVQGAEKILDEIVVGEIGDKYPLGKTEWMSSCKEGLEVTTGGVAAWAGQTNEGLSIKQGYGVKAWTIIGVYGGVITGGEGLYVLECKIKGDAFGWMPSTTTNAIYMGKSTRTFMVKKSTPYL
jgi:hypothetical protein